MHFVRVKRFGYYDFSRFMVVRDGSADRTVRTHKELLAIRWVSTVDRLGLADYSS